MNKRAKKIAKDFVDRLTESLNECLEEDKLRGSICDGIVSLAIDDGVFLAETPFISEDSGSPLDITFSYDPDCDGGEKALHINFYDLLKENLNCITEDDDYPKKIKAIISAVDKMLCWLKENEKEFS